MLPDDIVLKNVHYWANRLICKGIDYDALVSVGYIVGKPLKDARLLKDWIHFSMLRFIVNEAENRKMCIGPESDYLANVQETRLTPNYSDLYTSIQKTDLSKREASVISLYFFKNMSQKDIAKKLLISQPTVNVYIKRGLEKIKKVLLNRAI